MAQDKKKTPCQWRYIGHDQLARDKIANELNVSLPIAAMLDQLGYSTPESANKFLNPKLHELPSPFLLKGLKEAVSLTEKALENDEPVLIYGDYDVDGTTGTAALGLFLSSLGLKVQYCQPNRLIDGYGLHSELLQREIQAGFGENSTGMLLITVDCGISDKEQIGKAKELGFSTIVTDHHQPPDELPLAHAIINPWQPGCEFPFKDLAGVGVAFFFMMGVRSSLAKKDFWSKNNPPNLRVYLDLIALGTIADMVPLTGVNRILVRAGLIELARANRPGIKNLLRIIKKLGQRIRSEDVSFQLAPRLNAAGRLGKTDKALLILTTTNEEEGEKLANEIDSHNTQRREIEKDIFQQCLDQLKNQPAAEKNSIVVVGKKWHPGILGIVASRLVGEFFRPTVVLNVENNLAKGSVRSIPGVDIFEVIKGCKSLLEKFGGHKAAAGISLKSSNIQAFANRFEELTSSFVTPEILTPSIDIAWELDGKIGLSSKLLSDYFRLEPFGKGNEPPIFSSNTTNSLCFPKIVGNNHLSFQWQGGKEKIGGVGFNFGHLLDRLKRENGLVAFSLQINAFRGREKGQLLLKDVCFQSRDKAT